MAALSCQTSLPEGQAHAPCGLPHAPTSALAASAAAAAAARELASELGMAAKHTAPADVPPSAQTSPRDGGAATFTSLFRLHQPAGGPPVKPQQELPVGGAAPTGCEALRLAALPHMPLIKLEAAGEAEVVQLSSGASADPFDLEAAANWMLQLTPPAAALVRPPVCPPRPVLSASAAVPLLLASPSQNPINIFRC
jgi:hypothetical protein